MILLRPAVAVSIAAVACALHLAAPVHAKGDVRATLDDPSSLAQAAPGERVAVAFRLAVAPQAGAPAHAFGASGLYVRVTSAGGSPTRFAAEPPGGARAHTDGRYVATVTVPTAWTEAIAIGLEGQRLVRGMPPQRADMVFPVDNDPFPGPAVEGEGAHVPWGILGAAALAHVGSARPA